RDNWQGVKLFHVERGMRATPDNAVASWGERDMGNPKTLVDFVEWTRGAYPADRYALFFWGHSWSWHPGVTMWDSTSHDALNPREIRDVLPQLGFIDTIGYDSCNAGSIETEALWRGHAAAIAHSQEWVDIHGFAYDQILATLNDDPAMSGDDLAVVASRGAAAEERTWSAVALDGRWDALEAAVGAWSTALTGGLPAQRDTYHAALDATQHFVDAPMDRDLSDLAAQINARIDDAAIRAAGQAVIDAVATAVLSEQHRPNYPGAHGITIFVPSHTRGRTFAAYRNLDFARATGWDEFLRRWR
ncbi:MAG TPA: clostripain-related cysteine peptidase, partial [Thermomicrobiales bacterium]|nr:clostripain-related cysteine peptidase [Thermomicrobiales bacterium]